jgi:hypothetical protein
MATEYCDKSTQTSNDYEIGCILALATDTTHKIQIIETYCHHYLPEIYYYTKIIGDDSRPPSIMKESNITKYYNKI